MKVDVTGLPKKEIKDALTCLTKVEKLLGPNGKQWTQGAYRRMYVGSGAVEYCLVGALQQADGAGEVPLTTIMGNTVRIYSYSNEYRCASFEEIIIWNDNGSRKWSDVKSLLSGVRKALEKRLGAK